VPCPEHTCLLSSAVQLLDNRQCYIGARQPLGNTLSWVPGQPAATIQAQPSADHNNHHTTPPQGLSQPPPLPSFRQRAHERTWRVHGRYFNGMSAAGTAKQRCSVMDVTSTSLKPGSASKAGCPAPDSKRVESVTIFKSKSTAPARGRTWNLWFPHTEVPYLSTHAC
jgi:hypothetical protein